MITKKTFSALAAFALACLLVFQFVQPSPAGGKELDEHKKEAISKNVPASFPVVTLKDWRDSSDDARYSFLLGFATALEMEREWQGGKPLPLEESLNNSWIKGLNNRTFVEIHDNVNKYIAQNPGDLQRPLVEYLWYAYAQPKVDEKVSRKKFEHAKNIKKSSLPRPVID